MIDWWFRNRRTGEITIAQAPNLPLGIFLVAFVVRWALSPNGWPLQVLDVVAGGAIVWWAVDEVLRGVNPWRRALGLGTLAVVGARLVR